MAKQTPKVNTATKTTGLGNIFQYFDNLVQTKSNKVLITILLVASIFLIMCFDLKISIGNDDAMYVESANKWANDFTGYFYNVNAPFYVFFISLVIKVIGVKLFWLKLVSSICFLLFVALFYQVLKNKVPALVLLSTLAIVILNYETLLYASYTYTEMMYQFFVSLFMLFGIRLILKSNEDRGNIKSFTNIKDWLLFGFSILLLTLTRNVALVVVVSVCFYFLIKKDFKSILFTILSFGLFKVLYELIKKSIWGSKSILSDQLDIILRNDAYDASKGNVNFDGFVERFFGNTEVYLAGRFRESMGWIKPMYDFGSSSLGLFFFVIILACIVYHIYKKEKVVLFLTLSSIAVLAATFIALQTSWGQGRLIMVHYPFILLIVFNTIYQISKKIQFIYFLFFAIFFIPNLLQTTALAKKNLNQISKNIKGDVFAGYTDDWRNFLQLSQWCKDSLPKNSVVASRKGPMSFVYGGGGNSDFFPIYSVRTDRADTLKAILKRGKVTHVIFANLRLSPKISGDVQSMPIGNNPSIYLAYIDGDKKQIVNTIHNYFYPLVQENPNAFELVKVIGTDEEALLYKIKLD